MLLTLAQHDGLEAAYGCVTDRQLVADRIQRALAELIARSPKHAAPLSVLLQVLLGRASA